MVPPQTIIPGYSSELSGFKSSTKGEIMSQFSMLTSILLFNLHCFSILNKYNISMNKKGNIPSPFPIPVVKQNAFLLSL